MSANKMNARSGVIDPYKPQQGYVEATDWAVPYWASYLGENRIGSHEMFSHVNCSYLSTPGRPPTLAALKRHAQSLAHLISTIAPSQGPGEINNANSGDPRARRFPEGEAFDWLNNLEEVYNSDDPNHHRPLNSLVNQAKTNGDTKGVEFFCPLERLESKKSVRAEDIRSQREAAYQKECQVSPWQRHWNLLRHANDCLEILDHEFSSTGGILSILPTEHEVEAEQLDFAKNTLIGQWLLFTQQLPTRMHDIEINYANSLDTLKGEAIIPMQHLSIQGPDGRSGRELVFPQDRWILANAGEDVTTFIHQILDKKELAEQIQNIQYRGAGLSGDRLWDEATDAERGIVAVDLTTRFYRIKGSASDRGPLFILPAFADRTGTKCTRMMEDRPTVVSVVDPKVLGDFNSPTSLETSYRKKMAEMPTVDQAELVALRGEVKRLEKLAEDSQNRAMHESIRCENIRKAISPENERVAHVEELERRLRKSQRTEHEKEQQASHHEKLYNELMANEYSQKNAKGNIPRDIDGHATEVALNALLTALKKTRETNVRLESDIAHLQQNAREQSNADNAIR